MIATYNRAHLLRGCLESLARQTRKPDEVIVVTQGPDEAERKAVSAIGGELNVWIVNLPAPSMLEARNAGLREARGEIVVFTDDDILAPPQWLERLLSHYDDPKVGAVGGPTFPGRLLSVPLDPRHKRLNKVTLWGAMISKPYFDGREPVEVDHLGGANMSFRKELVRDGFDPKLGWYWTRMEMDLCLRVKRLDYRVIYDPGAWVIHRPTNSPAKALYEGDVSAPHYWRILGGRVFNEAYLLLKHSPNIGVALIRVFYQLLVCHGQSPGLLALPLQCVRRGPSWALGHFLHTLRPKMEGIVEGLRAFRRQQSASAVKGTANRKGLPYTAGEGRL